ncbi:hypothetical protein CK203_018257 [Vitis vinifera]|uniref:Uncharacterized protein n=1 Tax=Vitis vinifera TaxID=29760 RepID=A0A438JNY1_VITVI|nr:hypothetical protein CK203_018257 [Vitis vinifera]
MSKVAGLAVVSVICFTSSAFVALFTDIPVYALSLASTARKWCFYFTFTDFVLFYRSSSSSNALIENLANNSPQGL